MTSLKVMRSIHRGSLGDVVIPVHVDYAGFNQSGRGVITSSTCGKVKRLDNCLRTDLHYGMRFYNGELRRFNGEVYARKVIMSCDKPSCPNCYKYGWAVSSARRIGVRLEKASKQHGFVEHFVVSVPLEWYALSFDDLVKRVLKALKNRGVVGGVMIFHRDRFRGKGYTDPYWSFHFHVLGFASDRDKCRSCKKTCFRGCGGFVDRNYRLNEKDGCLVKVLGKRKSVVGTVWYQLHHSSYRVGAKRHNVVRWFGVCSYRRLKVVIPKVIHKCPLCGNDLVGCQYVGDDPEILAWVGLGRVPDVKLEYDAFLKCSASDWAIVDSGRFVRRRRRFDESPIYEIRKSDEVLGSYG
jgi:hypothetical protein